METSAYRRVTQITRHELRIKRSQFIGTAAPAPTREAAEEFIKQIKKEFHDATHNCFAYRIDPQTHRYSDDGEPAGTAGSPILAAIEKHQLIQTVVVVTRYFGGIKLGTGGLARAYGQCAEETLQRAPQEKIVVMEHLMVRFPYSMTGTIQQMLERNGARVEGRTYSEMVTMEVAVPRAAKSQLITSLIEATAGKIEIQEVLNGNPGS